ncbi:MAG: hypothetical protein CMJ76_01590 [Planctomycetaceae bacterium]|nr:hypothetical protein [Planctomycetaceae bacterium]
MSTRNYGSFVSILKSTLVLLAFAIFGSAANGAEFTPSLGVLEILADPAQQDATGLSPELTKRFQELKQQRLEIFASLYSENTPVEREVVSQEFRRASEQMALSLLTVSQRTRINQIQFRKDGLASLLKPEVRVAISISDKQINAIRAYVKHRNDLIKHATDAEKSKLHQTTEDKLIAILTPKQQRDWARLAGMELAQTALLQDTSENPSPKDDAADKDDPKEEDGQPTDDVPENSDSDDPPADKDDPKEEDDQPTDDADEKPDSDDPPADKDDPADQPAASNNSESMLNEFGEIEVRFAFNNTPWAAVIEWFAELNELSLQMDAAPEGTFNYTDPKYYSPAQAMDLMNGVLLTRGYTLLRRNQMLMIVNLENGVPDVLVEYVPLSELDERGEYELVKTLFQLVKMTPEEATADLEKLIGPTGQLFVFPAAKQVLVQEQAGRLRTIRDIIDGVETPRGELASKVEEIELEFVTAEDILIVARTMLNMSDGDFAREGLSFAVDTLGTRIFVTGEEENIAVLRDLAERLDKDPLEGVEETDVEKPTLRTHTINVADPQTTFDVLQTLLAGLPDVRLALDPATNKIIALARPPEHETIVSTIKELEGDVPVFEVISLQTLDPEMALAMIANMFGTTTTEDGVEVTQGPKVTADTVSMKLFVRATESEVASIRTMIERLESENTTTQDGNIRILPFSGKSAEDALNRAGRFWTGENKIRLVTPEDRSDSGIQKRTTDEPTQEQPPAPEPPSIRPTKADTLENSAKIQRNNLQFVSSALQDGETITSRLGNDIVVELTPDGIIIASDDTEALDRFESLLRQLIPPGTTLTDRQITVFYLKYVKSDVAKTLVQQIMSGGADSSSGLGSLVSDATSSLMGGGLMGMILGGGSDTGTADSSVFSASGTVSIVSDPRLNALVVQANDEDLAMIDSLLGIIDKEGSETEVETQGKPRLIPVTYVSATDIANILKEVYAGRINGASGGGQQQRQPNPEDIIKAMMQRGGGGRGGGSEEVKSEPAKLSIGVDATSNSIIVSAPEPLFKEVEELVLTLDQAGTQSQQQVEVRTLHLANPDVVNTALQAILGESVSTSRSSGGSSNNSGSNPGGNPAASADAIRQRIQAFQEAARRAAEARGGGGPPGGGRPGGGGPPGGGRPGGR